MNCANHPQRECVAYCQHCGKPLCPDCVRNVGTSVFCEPCFAARAGGPVPPGGFPYPGYPYPGQPQPGSVGPVPAAPSIPNPGLAALLGFIPGVGAMYNEQYAKGLVHLLDLCRAGLAVRTRWTSSASSSSAGSSIWSSRPTTPRVPAAMALLCPIPSASTTSPSGFSSDILHGRAHPTRHPMASRRIPIPAASPPASPPPTPAQTFLRPVPTRRLTATPYAPPVSHWTSAYGVPPIPPIPPIPPMPPYPDPNSPAHHRFPSGAVWLIALGFFFLLGNTALPRPSRPLFRPRCCSSALASGSSST